MKKKQIVRHRSISGLALVELMLVLGIASVLVAGSMFWLNSRKPVEFSNNARQIEAFFKEIQSEASSNIIPGYIGECTTVPRGAGCPIAPSDEVLGIGVSITRTGPNSPVNFRVDYLKSGTPTDDNPRGANKTVRPYSSRNFEIPRTVNFTGFRRYPNSGRCVNRTADYSNLNRDGNPAIGGTALNPGSNTVLLVFRKQPNSFYAFRNTTFNTAPPYAVAYQDNNPGLMVHYGYDNPDLPQLVSRPCAVSLQFESTERNATNGPRFTAELNFNFINSTVELVTR